VVLSEEGRSPRGRNLSTGKASPKWEPEAKAIIIELKALLKEWLTLDSVREEDTVPYSSFQNGLAERLI
jgi:hypothetical protein